jgi:predicted site-specific integrase-resolvase
MERISVGAREAAEMLGVSLTSLHRLTKAGLLHPWRLFGSKGDRYYSVVELREFVAKRTAVSVEEKNG